MKRIVLLGDVLLAGVVLATVLLGRIVGESESSGGRNGYLVTLMAIDRSEGVLLPVEVLKPVGSRGVAEEVVGHLSMSLYQEWVDVGPRRIVVSAPGYVPREFLITGATNLVALLERDTS